MDSCILYCSYRDYLVFFCIQTPFDYFVLHQELAHVEMTKCNTSNKELQSNIVFTSVRREAVILNIEIGHSAVAQNFQLLI